MLNLLSMHYVLCQCISRTCLEVDAMVEFGVLIPVSEPIDWVNSIVLSEMTNDKGEVTKIRVCLMSERH